MNGTVSINSDLSGVSSDMLYDSTPKQAVKLPGLNSAITFQEILENLSKYVHPSKIKSVLKDPFTQLYVVFLTDVESVCVLISNKLYFGTLVIRALPLFDCYIIEGVYPQVTNDEIRKIFEQFGHVHSILQLYALPKSSKFSHVLSGRREICFLLPADQTEIFIPNSLYFPPYKFRIIKYCFACSTEGHSVLNCPDIDEDYSLQLPDLNIEIGCVRSIGQDSSGLWESDLSIKDEKT